ncbi:MAG: PQQ-dependent sugar dehydrogenase [Alphaproteobacteria bacterium]
MVVAPNGTIYANSMGRGLIVLRDTNSDGCADVITRPDRGRDGGTGIALSGRDLFMEDGSQIIRYALDPISDLPAGSPDVVVSGLPIEGDHHSHSIAIGRDGALYVNLGSATNSCQIDNRAPESRGQTPCAEKTERAGIWRFNVTDRNVRFSSNQRYASGIRNAVGLAVNSQGQLFATQHGRDQLYENWDRLYNADQGANQPAEELIEVVQGADYGWPECYFDANQNRLVLAPEYGGDGGHAVGLCAARRAPIAAFPAHWAPNDLIIYEGTLLPLAYRGGAFIAFHGSWNRQPDHQDGYNVVFQPLKNGQASGQFLVFADGFAGPGKASGAAAYRPTGLAVAPDGALFVCDDNEGRVWRITYRGDLNAPLAPAPAY